MSAELPSTLQLVDAPELAALHVLEAALATVERALLAAYPELEEAICVGQPSYLCTEAWLADAIIEQVSGLESALHRYRTQLRARGLQRPNF